MKNTALITGAYGGLGTCFAEIHAKSGGNIILVGRSHDKLEEQKKKLVDCYHITVETIVVDLSKAEAAEQIYSTCREKNWDIYFL
ncbi:SDR family NAD(P)-dependent oxidoreductase [Lachnospiraceae bacterium OttesenSCG-928-D06]|nr:SDR family NAD(P)-dependent oxidoreductase [Lachnospiraceae bacterium OttesenSCG-928-D06]